MRLIWKRSLELAAAITLIALGAPVTAAPISIVNHSFELPPQGDGGFNGGPVTGWEVFGASGVFDPTVVHMSQGPTDGVQVGYSNNVGLALTQDLVAVVTADTLYTLRVDIQSRSDGFTHQSTTLQLLTADDDILASATLGALAGGTDAELTAIFAAGAGDLNLGEFLKIALIAGGTQSDWDNVRLDAIPLNANGGNHAVPEPGTLWLLGTALIGLRALRRKF